MKKPKRERILKIFLLAVLAIIVIGFLLPQSFTMPVQGASKGDYNSKSFWCYPWGKSVTHKGIDIFAKAGTPVFSSTYGLVVFTGNLGRGGNVILVLGPKWHFHYYAHLKEIKTQTFSFVSSGETIASVGNSGNAIGKPPHLHYSIATLIPYPWRWDASPQGWRKMFYLNPTPLLDKAS